MCASITGTISRQLATSSVLACLSMAFLWARQLLAVQWRGCWMMG